MGMRLFLATGTAVLCSALATTHWVPGLSQYGPLNVTRDCSVGMNTLELDMRQALRTLPEFGVFDHLAYRVGQGVVTLSGEVMAPDLRYLAEGVAWTESGVISVNNEIHVLTVSPAENELRKAVFVAIYSDPVLQPYTRTSGGMIHIVVEGHRVILEGEVSSKTDAERALRIACAVAGAAAAVSHLTVCY